MSKLIVIGEEAVRAAKSLRMMDEDSKNSALTHVANSLIASTEYILFENAKDINRAKEIGMHSGLIDRLLLDSNRVLAIADGIEQIARLNDPIGQVIDEYIRPNGMKIIKERVPMGVIGIIYESRPNVTADAFGLCFKSGNAVILKGGSDAINSNIAITNTIKRALNDVNIDSSSIALIESTDRRIALEFMRLNKYIDVLIPRGGSNLINSVIKESNIPVIETGTGNCHIYIDEYADIDMAIKIVTNAKTQRIGVCNACESLVVNSKIASIFLPRLESELDKYNMEYVGDDLTCALLSKAIPATEDDYYKEYLDYKISIICKDNINEAIEHINIHSTKHSEAIITDNHDNANLFLRSIDSACVYHNASTRFTDGYEFGLGAEIGISTQKLHARGPMGLNELTSYKYKIIGNGQVR